MSRGRSRYRTPQSNRKRPRIQNSTRSKISSVIEDLMDMSVSTYTRSPIARSIARSLTRYALDAAKPAPTAARTKKYGNSFLGGKMGRKMKKYKGKLKRKGKPTQYGMENKGVSSVIELRYTIPEVTDPATNPNNTYESIQVAHNTMPIKESLLSLMRALVKKLLLEHGIYIRDFSAPADSYGIVVGDIIRINQYYPATATTVSTASSYTYVAGNTFDAIADALARGLQSTSDAYQAKFDSVEFVPSASSKLSAINYPLAYMKASVKCQSYLKIQNRTVTVTADDQVDDVNNVPIVGKLIKFKGNNLPWKINRPYLQGIGAVGVGGLTYNDIALEGRSTRAQASRTGTTDYTFTGDVTQGPFYKASEIPQPWHFRNTVSHSKVRIQPGSIKTSVMKTSFNMSIQKYLMILLGSRGANEDKLVYSPQAGYCSCFFLEKLVGNSQSSVLVAYEVELRLVTAVTGKLKQWTSPIYQQSDVV